MGRPLTDKQRSVLEFLREFARSRSFAPTAMEVAGRFGIAEKNAFYYLELLERKGYIRRRRKSPRRIEFLGGGGQAPVKRTRRQKEGLRPDPATPAYAPLDVPNGAPSFRIAGKVVGIFRKL